MSEIGLAFLVDGLDELKSVSIDQYGATFDRTLRAGPLADTELCLWALVAANQDGLSFD